MSVHLKQKERAWLLFRLKEQIINAFLSIRSKVKYKKAAAGETEF